MTKRIFSTLLVAAIAAASLAGTVVASAESKAKGVLETVAGIYEFDPKLCGIYRQDDFDDIEIGGPGTAPDGEEFYFELSSTANALSLDLGVNTAFASSERSLKAGRYVSQEFTLVVSGQQIEAADLVLVDENGVVIDETASLTIDCN